MNNSKQLANRFREVLLNGTWIANTNYKDQLTHLTWEQATLKVGSLNTIAELTYHTNYYIAGILNVFQGGELEIRDKYSFDLLPIESQQAWEELLFAMYDNAEKFADCVEAMSDGQLEAVFVKKQYGNYQRSIEGMIEHSYYHLGQIVLIRKMIVGSIQ